MFRIVTKSMDHVNRFLPSLKWEIYTQGYKLCFQITSLQNPTPFGLLRSTFREGFEKFTNFASDSELFVC